MPDDAAVFHFYNPFMGRTLRTVFKRNRKVHAGESTSGVDHGRRAMAGSWPHAHRKNHSAFMADRRTHRKLPILPGHGSARPGQKSISRVYAQLLDRSGRCRGLREDRDRGTEPVGVGTMHWECGDTPRPSYAGPRESRSRQGRSDGFPGQRPDPDAEYHEICSFTVEPGGIEPPTSCMPCGRSLEPNALIFERIDRLYSSRIDVRSASLSLCFVGNSRSDSGRYSIVLPREFVVGLSRAREHFPRRMECRVRSLGRGLAAEHPKPAGGVGEVLGSEVAARIRLAGDSTAGARSLSKRGSPALDAARPLLRLTVCPSRTSRRSSDCTSRAWRSCASSSRNAGVSTKRASPRWRVGCSGEPNRSGDDSKRSRRMLGGQALPNTNNGSNIQPASGGGRRVEIQRRIERAALGRGRA